MRLPAAFPTIEARPEKVDSRHLERLAVVYVRQSTMAQVQRNQESTKLQYSLTTVAQRLGWDPDRILVVDDDLGQSGKWVEGRDGFQRVLSEVALDHVGLIVGSEVSRSARSNRDWQQLLELCSRFGTLIADLDGIYDPSRYNDRLLLGLKGTMSEAELHILRQRLMQGKLQKARRGELSLSVPSGYLRKPSGEMILDPDEEVRAVIALIFANFERIGTVHGVLRHLVKHKIQIGVRLRVGPDIGRLVWRRPNRTRILDILRHPIYAGIYTYGRKRVDPRRQKAGHRASGQVRVPPEEWYAFVPDRLPAFITRDQFERNQLRLTSNRASAMGTGPIRNGRALLQGLVVCSHCNRRMQVQYAPRGSGKNYYRYACTSMAATYGEPLGPSLSGPCIDRAVSELAMAALTPAALEVSMKVADQLERERARANALWEKRLQRARYEAERAQAQFEAVEPENRLVGRSLEKQWEEKLQAERALQEEYRRHLHKQPRHLTAAEKETIRSLASNLPKLWTAPTTTPADRKTVLRLLIDRVMVAVEHEWVDFEAHWSGGRTTKHRIRRPLGRLSSMNRHKELMDEILALRRAGHTAEQIAEKLNHGGWVTPTQRNSFNERLVRAMLHRYGNVPRGSKPPPDGRDEWWPADLAKELGMPLVTLYGWKQRGWVKYRRVKSGWVAIAGARERARLLRLRRSHPHHSRRSRRKKV